MMTDRFHNTVREIENAWIELKDGCRLAARIWLPEGAEAKKVPAILEYLPYRKRDGTAVRDQLTHPYFAAHGYACLRVDMRGNGESDGVMLDEYLKQEQDDAIEVLDWIARQPWSTGKVGMIGISWGGFNGLQVAARRPEPLKAVVSICSTVDRYADDIHYKGGCQLNENLGWSSTMFAYSSRPPDPALVGDRWREIWMERLENEPLLIKNWLEHQRRDEYWKHGSICEDWNSIEAAVLAVGGWADAYRNAPLQLVANLKAPCKALIGPWLHKYPHFAVPAPRIGFLQECLRWWDYWLKGIDTGVMKEPDVRAYMQDSVPASTFYKERPGRWIAEPSWPSPHIRPLTLAMNADGLAPQAGPETPLELASPQTTGSVGGEYCAIWLGPESPGDQRVDDAGSLCFDGAPLAAPLEIFGTPEIELELAIDKPQGFVCVRLCDVWPDGQSVRVSYGFLNLAHRDSHEHPSPVPVGQWLKVKVKLDDCAHAFRQGNRLRIAVSTSYWPMIWPAPEPVHLTLQAGKCRAILPERPHRAETAPHFEPPDSAPPLKLETVRKGSNIRRLEQDLGSGEWKLVIEDDFGETRDTTHGLVSGGAGRETWRVHPDDPLQAVGETHWTMTVSRPGWSTRTETYCRLRADRTRFFLEARLEAYEGDKLVLEREWKSEHPREMM
jgi:putative CocE/NonD family hydrolase